MGGSETEAPEHADRPGAFLLGASLAIGCFLVLHRFELAGVPYRLAVGAAAATMLAGAGIGARVPPFRRRGGRLGLALIGLLLWGGWTLGIAPSALLPNAAASCAGLGVLWMMGSTGAWRRSDGVPLFGGVAAGSLLCALGTAAHTGVLPMAVIAVGLALVSGALPRTLQPDGTDARMPRAAAAGLLVAAAVGCAGVGVMRGYVVAAGSLPYGGADLLVAFSLGALAASASVRGRGRTDRTTAAAAVSTACIALIAGYGFAAYPDVVLSESGALQCPQSLLTGGRIFAFWLWAFGLGCAGGAVWPKTGGRGVPVLLMAVGAGAALTCLGGAAYRVPYVAATLLCAAAAAGSVPDSAEPRLVQRAPFRSVLAVALLAASGWAMLADPHCAWAGLRETFLAATGQTAQRAAAQLRPDGLAARLRSGSATARFVNGNMVSTSGADDAYRLRAATLLDAVRQAAGVAESHSVGPDELSAPCGPARAISVDALRRLHGGAPVCVWLPIRGMDVKVSRRILATCTAVFTRTVVFAVEDGAVVLCGEEVSLDYARLRTVQRELDGEGVWSPMDPIRTMAADEVDLGPMAAGMLPFRASRPERMPLLAADPMRAADGAALAAVAQFRMRGARRAAELVRFADELDARVALASFEVLYSEDTAALLRSIGEASAASPERLAAFLHGPNVVHDLFSRPDEVPAVRQAAVLIAFGMPQAAVNALTAAVQSGGDNASVRVSLGGIMVEMSRPNEALEHYRKALELSPGSVDVLGKVAALQLSMGRYASGAEALERVIEAEPDNLAAMTMLAEVYAGPLKRRDRCAELAAAILDLEPGNQAAKQLLAICGG